MPEHVGQNNTGQPQARQDEPRARAVGVVFGKSAGVLYYQPGPVAAKPGDYVVARVDRATDVGQVSHSVYLPRRQVAKMPRLIRKATEEDLAQRRALEEEENRALEICRERIAAHGLPMRLITSHYTLDRRRLTFYFSADGRVDFRALVRDLARIFKCRIELRQVGVRDYAKLIGGVGVCGRPLCCATFLHAFAPISMRMAKEQGMALNPVKLSGLCDRLMCCLLYEYEVYKELSKGMPTVGQTIQTDQGVATVAAVNVLAQTVDLAFEDGRLITVPVAQLQARATARASEPARAQPTSDENSALSADATEPSGSLTGDADANAAGQDPSGRGPVPGPADRYRPQGGHAQDHERKHTPGQPG